MNSEFIKQIQRRRTFAIISHPDAGKTTLTEKILLLGGAIRMAGQVRAKGENRRAHSDWMKIEQSRGISVTTSVMTFEYGGATFNLLDTPGHEDFSEDTYRTLTAVDSAIMVIDAAKGIEAQTRKLFEVCRLRDVPIVTFVNKMDREGRDPFEIVDEVAQALALDTVPMMWPAGCGNTFKGCYSFLGNSYIPYGSSDSQFEEIATALDGNVVAAQLGEGMHAQLIEEAELAQAAYPEFSIGAYREGHMTPVFFGSALKSLGVKQLLDGVLQFAPSPRPQPADLREIKPDEEKVTGFVFKVQANMDPKHRDRIAFMRLCSGKFRRNMRLTQMTSGKSLSIHNPIMFFAQSRDLAEEAWPGDIIGIPNHGTLRVGDTLTEGEKIHFTGIPDFAPEILQHVRPEDPMKAKHLQKALISLAEEGVTQVFRPHFSAGWIVGVVGRLQLDVLLTRIEHEYGIKVAFEPAPFVTSRWVSGGDDAEIKRFLGRNKSSLAEDRDGCPVYMARNSWDVNRIQEDFPKLRFTATKERSTATPTAPF